MSRKISQIAFEIDKDWKNVFYGARPYLDAMYELDSINDKYGVVEGKWIIGYFLSNASTWRGEVARNVKKELNQMLKGK